MWKYFYHYHNKPMAFDLFTKNPNDGEPTPPPSGEFISTENGLHITTETSESLITE